MEDKFDHKSVEKKWRDLWERAALDVSDVRGARKPFYNLMMFPYPSAEGLHVGNMYAFTGSDIYGRFKRMHGYNVFEPIGLDGFGIHSENYAFKIGKHPMDQAVVSQRRFYDQLHKIGAMYDWSRTVETYDPDYYRWTQWIFVQMFKYGLAYRAKAHVNWCPSCKTVLADEQVIEGNCERCGNLVSNRLLEQWFFKITAYAGKLLDNLPSLDWAKKVKIAQERWIGKKEGWKIKFGDIEIFTTRPDTIYGATFIVLSPQHRLAGKIKSVVNPVTKKEIPVFVDEYVLGEVGTGAIMGVPAYDERDMVFAKRMNLPIIKAKLTKKIFGDKMIIYHLRDWLISRQRYWGPPIPMIFCQNCKENSKGERKDMPGWWAVPEDQLPVVLPRIEDYKPGDDGVAPLAKHKEFYETTCPGCGGKAVRETDVSDTFLDSSWYFLRYPSVGFDGSDFSLLRAPKGDASRSKSAVFGQQLSWDPAITKKWLPVHMYTGGAEHSVLHLLYSRFICMALKDMGHIDFEEPFTRFYAHGLIIKDGAKMSKSRGNIVNPDEYIEHYGADALRLYLMFTGPFDQGGDFRDSAMEGMSRWTGRIWRMALKSIDQRSNQSSAKAETALQHLIKKVGDDIERRRYNTAIAAMMEFTNIVADNSGVLTIAELQTFLKLLAPFAPYLTEELWEKSGGKNSIHLQMWPVFDESALVEDTASIIIQVNGKHRETLTLEAKRSTLKDEVEKTARASEKVKKYLAGAKVKNVVFVPGRLINFVI